MSDKGCADNVVEKSSKKWRKRHNTLERRRRDQIKDSFEILKDTIPLLRGDKPVSRADILRKASEYIEYMKIKNDDHQQDIDNLNRQNAMLEYQIKQLERVKATGNYTVQHIVNQIQSYQNQTVLMNQQEINLKNLKED